MVLRIMTIMGLKTKMMVRRGYYLFGCSAEFVDEKRPAIRMFFFMTLAVKFAEDDGGNDETEEEENSE